MYGNTETCRRFAAFEGNIHIVLNMIEGFRKGYVWDHVRSDP